MFDPKTAHVRAAEKNSFLMRHPLTARPAIPPTLMSDYIDERKWSRNTSINAPTTTTLTAGHVSPSPTALGSSWREMNNSISKMDYRWNPTGRVLPWTTNTGLILYIFFKILIRWLFPALHRPNLLLLCCLTCLSSLEFYHRPSLHDPTIIGGNAYIAWLTRYRFRFCTLTLITPTNIN